MSESMRNPETQLRSPEREKAVTAEWLKRYFDGYIQKRDTEGAKKFVRELLGFFEKLAGNSYLVIKEHFPYLEEQEIGKRHAELKLALERVRAETERCIYVLLEEKRMREANKMYEKKIGELKGQLNEMKEEISKLKDENKQLRAELDSNDFRIKDLANQVANKEQAVLSRFKEDLLPVNDKVVNIYNTLNSFGELLEEQSIDKDKLENVRSSIFLELRNIYERLAELNLWVRNERIEGEIESYLELNLDKMEDEPEQEEEKKDEGHQLKFDDIKEQGV